MEKNSIIISIVLALTGFGANFLFAETTTISSSSTNTHVVASYPSPESEIISEPIDGEPTNAAAETIEEDCHREEGEEGSGHGGMEPLFFIIIALVIGAGTRHFFRKIPLPFTVLLLLFGILLGLINRFSGFDGWGETFSISLEWAGNIDPHVILFIFLPILIFEASFAMDVHTFKKTATNAIILAVPGIILALALTAALMIGLQVAGLIDWGVEHWAIALMFGSVISATDPVAVTALLKELGASKKLGTLIEGESMLNDGTAIVFFMVFYLPLIGMAGDSSAVADFARVSFGGILVGLIIAGVSVAWVKRVFNDALVEISVIIAAAYMAFFVAEHFMHVSGVLALVSLGLVMAGVGRTRISPEVEHFLHEFWELAAFIANILIFIIVGVVISQRTEFTATDFIVLGVLFIGLHVIRGLMIILFFPLMRRFGYGLDKKEATILWYGALRGAIALALALVVKGIDDDLLSPEIKNQFFFYISGIVILTLLINATTIKLLVKKLGLTRLAPAKELMIVNASLYLRQSSEHEIEKLKKERFLKRANWNIVHEYLPETIEPSANDLASKVNTIAEFRSRMLEKEKSTYWKQFSEGMLGPVAVKRLSDVINDMLDKGGTSSLAKRKDLEEMWQTPRLLNKIQSMSIVGKLAERAFFERLAVGYDSACGFVVAQEECLKLVESLFRSGSEVEQKELTVIEGEINENLIQGQTFLRNLRNAYPEIYNTISTRQAIRSLLNYEMHTVDRLQKKGWIDSGEAEKMIDNIEERMKKLQHKPPVVKMPDTDEILRNSLILRGVGEAVIKKMADSFQKRVFAVGDTLIKETTGSDGIYLISRGNAKVSVKDQDIAMIGEGSTVGEMGVLTGSQRNATITAESPVTSLWMSYNALKEFLNSSQAFKSNLWKIAGERFTENLLCTVEPYCYYKPKKFRKWLEQGKVLTLKKDEIYELTNEVAILISGKAKMVESNKFITAPALINFKKFKLEEDSCAYLCSTDEV